MNFNKELQLLKFDGAEIQYYRPGIAQTPFMLQWMIEGFLQSIPSEKRTLELSQEALEKTEGTNPEKTVRLLEILNSQLSEGLRVIKVANNKPLETATTSEKFEYVIEQINFLNESEDYNFEEIIGAAMIGTEASIKYLYPVFEQCFPELNPFLVKDEVFNFAMGYLINDFFSDLVARIQK